MSDEPTQPSPSAGDDPTQPLAPPPTGSVEAAATEMLAATPPPGPPPEPASQPWPGSAKATAAFLGLAAVAAVIAAIVGFTRSTDDGSDEIAALEQQVATLQAEADGLEAERDAVTAELETATAAIEDANEQLADAQAQNADLAEQLVSETQRADDAEAAIEAIAGLLPIEVDASLDAFDLVGPYSVEFSEAFCEGLPDCGSLPGVNQANIRTTPQGFLELVVDNVLTVGLFAVDGSLFGVVDSNDVVEPCNGVPRVARVSVTMFADGVTIDGDATRSLTGLGASLVVDAPAVEGCAAGLVFYGASLTPVG